MNNQDLYFKNHEAKIIFGLVVLGGKPQMDLLGIDYSHYSDKKIAEILDVHEKVVSKWIKEYLQIKEYKD